MQQTRYSKKAFLLLAKCQVRITVAASPPPLELQTQTDLRRRNFLPACTSRHSERVVAASTFRTSSLCSLGGIFPNFHLKIEMKLHLQWNIAHRIICCKLNRIRKRVQILPWFSQHWLCALTLHLFFREVGRQERGFHFLLDSKQSKASSCPLSRTSPTLCSNVDRFTDD